MNMKTKRDAFVKRVAVYCYEGNRMANNEVQNAIRDCACEANGYRIPLTRIGLSRLVNDIVRERNQIGRKKSKEYGLEVRTLNAYNPSNHPVTPSFIGYVVSEQNAIFGVYNPGDAQIYYFDSRMLKKV